MEGGSEKGRVRPVAFGGERGGGARSSAHREWDESPPLQTTPGNSKKTGPGGNLWVKNKKGFLDPN